MDFFAMILESVLDRVNAIFGPIQNPVLKAILQIIAVITQSKKQHALRTAFTLVAGAGFEPHDLRVMSPTSYQTAPPRDIDFAFASKTYYSR